MAAGYCIALFVVLLAILHCSGRPNQPLPQSTTNTKESHAHMLLVLQSPHALKLANEDDPKKVPYKTTLDQPPWLIYKLLVSSAEPVKACEHKLNDTDVYSPDKTNKQFWDNIINLWPNLFLDKKESYEIQNYRQQFQENGVCARKYEFNVHNGEESYKQTAAYYYQQAVNLFNNGIGPFTPIKNTRNGSTVDNPAANYIVDSLKNLFAGEPPFVKHLDVETAAKKFSLGPNNIKVYLGCQKSNKAPNNEQCCITRVGLCFKCLVDDTGDSDNVQHNCTPNPSHPNSSPQGDFISCGVPEEATQQTPWNDDRVGSPWNDISCYSDECKVIVPC